jgi:hypothetical protein
VAVSTGIIVLAGCLVMEVRRASEPIANFDTYFHLRFGHEFLTGWSLRDPGSVSTFATADWVPTQWLPQVAMAWLDETFGLAAVAWLNGLQVIALLVVLYLSARRRADPHVLAIPFLAVLYVCLPWLSPRPQVLSYLLVAVTAAVWWRAVDRRTTPWALVPVTWLWAMLHGMWPLGLVIGAAVTVAAALDERSWARLAWQRLAVVVLSAVAAALTPVGPALYGQVVAVGDRSQFFSEWAPPVFTNADCVVLLTLIGITAILMWRGERASWTEIVLLVLTALFALYSARTLPVSAVMVLPLVAGRLQTFVGGRSPVSRGERGVVLGMAALAVLALALIAPRTADEPAAQPPWVGEELGALPAGTPVLSEWGYSGYLMWRFPQLDPVMNGYGDTFTLEELQRNTDIRAVAPGWDDMVRETGARVAVLQSDSALGYALEGQGWTVEHESDGLEMLTAPDTWR